MLTSSFKSRPSRAQCSTLPSRATCTPSRTPCAPSPARRRRRNNLARYNHRLLQHATLKRANQSKYPCPLIVPPSPVVASTQVQVPCTLPIPCHGDVDPLSIGLQFPELANVPLEYMRQGLAITRPQMLASLAQVSAQPCPSALPSELEVRMADPTSPYAPSHMLAIYSPSTTPNTCKIDLYPTHSIVLSSHCVNLPVLPSTCSTSTPTSIPVVPLYLPSAETFPVLEDYLYTKRIDTLLAALLPTPTSCADNNTSIRSASDLQTSLAKCSPYQLARSSIRIMGVWRNACALGVVDKYIYSVLSCAWENVAGALAELQASAEP